MAAAAVGDAAAVRHLAALAAARRDDAAALSWAARLASGQGPEQAIVDCLEEFAPRSRGLETPWLPHVVRWLRRAATARESWAIARLGCDESLVVEPTKRGLFGGPPVEGPSEALSGNEQAEWRGRAADSGSRRAAFLLAADSSETPPLAERWFRRVWLGVEDVEQAVEGGLDDVCGAELLAAAHELALATAQRASDEARVWFSRCTSAGDWYESRMHTNDSRAALDYYHWAATHGETETAERLLASLVHDACAWSRLGQSILEGDAHNAYRDSWRDMSLDMWVWHEAYIERAKSLLRSHDVAESSRMIRLASEMACFSRDEHAVVSEILSTLGPSCDPLPLTMDTLGGTLSADAAASIAALLRRPRTAGATREASRVSYGLLDWLVREYYPAWLDLARAYDLASWLRQEAPPIVDSRSAGECLVAINGAFRRGDVAFPSVDYSSREPRQIAFERITQYGRMDLITSAATRSVMNAVGGDVAADVADDGGVLGASRAASRRFLSGTNLWLAMWAATVNDEMAGADDDDRDRKRHHPWRELWDFASTKAWEAAQVACDAIVFEFCTQADVTDEIFDPVAILDMAFSPTTTALKESVGDMCVRVALAATEAG